MTSRIVVVIEFGSTQGVSFLPFQRDLSAERFESFRRFPDLRAFEDDLDHPGTDHDTICSGGGDEIEVGAVVDPKADGEGDGGEGADTRDEFGEAGGHGCTGVGPGHAHLDLKSA